MQLKTDVHIYVSFLVYEIILQVRPYMSACDQTLQILVSLRKLNFELKFFLSLHYVTTIRNQSLYLYVFF